MKNLFIFTVLSVTSQTVVRVLLGFMLAASAALSAQAQGEIASGTVSGSGSGPYTYTLTIRDATGATSPIGSIWYAWVPGSFYLPGTPTSASAPAGWTAVIDGDSIRFTADSAANDIAPGQSLSGFNYDAAFSPAQLAAAPNSGLSVAYSGGLFSDAGDTFTVATVPEPSTPTLLICGAAAWALTNLRRWRPALGYMLRR